MYVNYIFAIHPLRTDNGRSYLLYLIFNPLVFTIKLHIELNLAEMIACIAQSVPLHQCGAQAPQRQHLDQHNDATMIIQSHRTHHQCQAGSQICLATDSEDLV